MGQAGPVSQSERHASVGRSYDAVAEQYAAHFEDELAGKPLDRALLGVLLSEMPPGLPLVDLGCGPGHVAAWAAGRGVRAVGIDLSARMVEVARTSHPEVEFRQGDLLSLPAADGEFGAAVALYAVIHLDPGDLPTAFAEMRRALVPDGRLLIAVHVGDEVRHLEEWWGEDVDLDFHFFDPVQLTAQLRAAGFVVEATLTRSSYPQEVETQRAYVLARRHG